MSKVEVCVKCGGGFHRTCTNEAIAGAHAKHPLERWCNICYEEQNENMLSEEDSKQIFRHYEDE
eukprot:7539678-Karenia_brevis.AAC.1